MPQYLPDGRYVNIPEFWRDPVHRALFIEPDENANSHKVGKVLGEFKRGTLHSGSKHGPVVTSRDQAIAIAMSEAGLSRRKKK